MAIPVAMAASWITASSPANTKLERRSAARPASGVDQGVRVGFFRSSGRCGKGLGDGGHASLLLR